MTLLVVYVLIALLFSFLCSIAEAVILSVTPPYVALLDKNGRRAGTLLRAQVDDIGKPLAAILTLNTIAHTVGAAGAGAQAAKVFGSAYLGVASAVLTLLILIFSEIIPKTLGAHYWRPLAPAVAHGLHWMVRLLYPFVLLSEWITRHMTDGPRLSGFSRSELQAMAEVGAREGSIGQQESDIVRNLFRLNRTTVSAAMTPHTVMFTAPRDATVGEFFEAHDQMPFSRIPVWGDDPDDVVGFVLRADLMLAQARGQGERTLGEFLRDLPALPETLSLAAAFDELVRTRAHIVLIVDEFGDVQGLLTLEDIIETLLGLEIVDESDTEADMQKVARRLWEQRARRLGLTGEK